MKRSSDATYSTWLMVGIGLLVGGLLLGVMMAVAGMGQRSNGGGGVALIALASVCFLAAVTGLGILVATLTAGLRATGGKVNSKPITRIDGARIQARYAVNSLGETIFDESYLDFEDPKTKLYVRIAAPGLTGSEFKCDTPVWTRCGEGMVGVAMIQGDWLGQFFPQLAEQAQGDPYRSD